MNDIQNGSYLMAGGIWAELNRRKSFARFATIKNLLSSHITRTLYDEYLIKRQDEEFNEQLHKQIASVESEISTLLAFVKAFDRMAEFMQDETAGFVEEWYKTKHQNLILNQLLDAQTELAHTWGETAFKLYGDYIQQQATSTKFTNA